MKKDNENKKKRRHDDSVGNTEDAEQSEPTDDNPSVSAKKSRTKEHIDDAVEVDVVDKSNVRIFNRFLCYHFLQ